MTGIRHPSSSSSTNMTDNAFELHVHVLTSIIVLTSFIIVLFFRSLSRRDWEELDRSSDEHPEKSLTCHWKSFIDSHVEGWSSVTATGIPLSLTWLSLLPLSTNAGPIMLLCTGPGALCALASVLVSMVYARNRHLFEFIMKDKRVTVLPFDIWTFLSLPWLYIAWSLLLLGVVLFFCLLIPGHHPFLSKATVLDIPVPILSTGLSILVTLIPCGLIAQNFQVLSQARAIEPGTTPESLKPMELSFPSVLESTEAVTSEKVLGLVPIAAHAIVVFCPTLLAISDFYNNPITRISLITAIIAGSFSVILRLLASRQPAACAKRALVLPMSFLALSALAFFFSLLAHFWTNEE